MSQEFLAPTPEELDPYFPAFKVTDFIAQGGMGAVFKATQLSLDRPVAIKILPYELGLDPIFSNGFETEAKAMAKLNHPNLVQVYDFGNIDGMLYIIMEFVPGRSLYYSARGKRIDVTEACTLISSMCRGLEHAHEAGLIHRDIKPANVLIDAHARPKIVDFGLARPLDDTHSGGSIFGTKGYTAPEVISDPKGIDQRADIYSVGIMLYELLTGQLPPHPYVPASKFSDSDPEFDTIILKAIHPQRQFRYPSAGEMADELDKLAKRLEAETLKATEPATPSANTPRPPKTQSLSIYAPYPQLQIGGSPSTQPLALYPPSTQPLANIPASEIPTEHFYSDSSQLEPTTEKTSPTKALKALTSISINPLNLLIITLGLVLAGILFALLISSADEPHPHHTKNTPAFNLPKEPPITSEK